MNRALFVSCNYASDYADMTWGTYIRMRLLLEGACAAFDAVDLLLFVEPDMLPRCDPDAVSRSLMQTWGVETTVRLAPRSRAAHAGPVATLRGLFDIRYLPFYGQAGGAEQAQAVAAAVTPQTRLIVAHRLDAALAVTASGVDLPVVINLDDVEHVGRGSADQAKPLASRAAERWFLRTLERDELKTLQKADCLLVCSAGESDYLRRRGISVPIEVIPNGIAFPENPPGPATEVPTVLFIGSFVYEPNVDAAEKLIHEIFPRIRARCPTARLSIAGHKAELLPSFAAVPAGVEIRSSVPDLDDLYRSASVACCPMRGGSGTRIKIIEAAAWKLPVVSTALGAGGIDLVDGADIVIAETWDDIADACVALLEHPDRARAMGASARARLCGANDRLLIAKRLSNVYRDVAEARARTADVQRA